MGGGLSLFRKKDEDYCCDSPEKPVAVAGKINIYFASATGKSENFAKTIVRELNELGFDADYFNLNEFKSGDILNCKLALFLMSSSGDGQAPFQARPFMEWIKNADALHQIPKNSLNTLSFSVFGLGNMEYRYYNKCGMDTDKYLEALGGNRLMEIGLGDDSNGNLDDDFEHWKDRMISNLMVKCHPNAAALGYRGEIISQSGSSKIPAKVRTDFRTVVLSAADVAAEAGKPPRVLTDISIAASNIRFFTAQLVKVTANRELRTESENAGLSTRHIELELKGSGLRYQAADNVAILPENTTETVETVARALEYNLDEVVRLQPKQMSVKASARQQREIRPFAEPFPTPCSVRDILTKYLDLKGPLPPSLLLQLFPYITDSEQKTWLTNLLSKNRKAEYKEFMGRTHSGIADLLNKELSSVKIPLADLLHILPYMQPRFYTIASSSSQYPTSVHLCCTWSHQNAGLCSSYLKGLVPDQDSVRIFIQDSTFRLPASASTPITMIGPGTGIAPMRALLQERYQQQLKGTKVGSTTLYFGCKNSQHDFIYKEELFDYRDNKKILTHLHLAFSREDPNKKVYVQHMLAEESNAKALLTDLEAGGYIYVCGSTGMGKDVMSAVRTLLVQGKNKVKSMSEEAAQKFLDGLVHSGRYVQELWG